MPDNTVHCIGLQEFLYSRYTQRCQAFEEELDGAVVLRAKSMSVSHVINIGHLMTGRLDVLYLRPCAVSPPYVNIFQSSGSISFRVILV